MAPVTLRETFGVDSLRVRAREAWLGLRGSPHVPPTRFDTTSLGVLRPALSVQTWLGMRRADRRIPIYNLFNHLQPPAKDGWSVRKTQVRDFRGGRLSYDSHNGTDFAIPVGTTVVAPADGVVRRVSNEFNRGGLKVFIDHGQNLITTSNHLARALVSSGERVRRGQPIALSGYSGMDGLLAFPWSVPHVHFNVWLNGEYVDPFGHDGEVPLWLDGNDPRCPEAQREHEGEERRESALDTDALDAAITCCLDSGVRQRLTQVSDEHQRAMDLLFYRNYYPAMFRDAPNVYAARFARAPRLSLPFLRDDFDGVFFLED